MDADYVGTIMNIGSQFDRNGNILVVLLTVCVSEKFDTLTVGIPPESTYLYHVGQIVQIGIHGQYLVIVPH